MSGLSHRVMNMKFMQKTEKQDQRNEKEPGSSKVKDSSEWINPHSKNLLKQIQISKNSNSNIQSIGYGSINSFNRVSSVTTIEEEDEPINDTPIIPTRRTWGNNNITIDSNKDKELLALSSNKLKEYTPKGPPKSDFQKLNNNKNNKIQEEKEEEEDDDSLEIESVNEPSSTDKLDTLWNSIGTKRKQEDNTDKPQIKNKRKRFTK